MKLSTFAKIVEKKDHKKITEEIKKKIAYPKGLDKSKTVLKITPIKRQGSRGHYVSVAFCFLH